MSSNILTSDQKDTIIKAIGSYGNTAIELSNSTGFEKKVINNLLFSLEGKQVYKRFVTGSNKPLWYIIIDEKNVDKRQLAFEKEFANNTSNNKINNTLNNKINNTSNNITNKNINNISNTKTNNTSNTKVDNTTNNKINKNVKFNTQEQKTISKPYIIIDLGNVHDCLQKLELYEGRVIAICNGAYLGYGVGEKCKNKNIEVIKYESLDGNTVMSEIFYKVSHLLTSIADDIIVASQSKFFTYLPEIAERHGKNITVVRDWDKLKTLI